MVQSFPTTRVSLSTQPAGEGVADESPYELITLRVGASSGLNDLKLAGLVGCLSIPLAKLLWWPLKG